MSFLNSECHFRRETLTETQLLNTSEQLKTLPMWMLRPPKLTSPWRTGDLRTWRQLRGEESGLTELLIKARTDAHTPKSQWRRALCHVQLFPDFAESRNAFERRGLHFCSGDVLPGEQRLLWRVSLCQLLVTCAVVKPVKMVSDCREALARPTGLRSPSLD
nr:PREDICTED: uncharacterized protein LOC104152272 isoform X5 [Struthio camelus australis]